MKIQIVYPEDGWILNKLAKYLIDGLDCVTGNIDKPVTSESWDLTYYMNYFLYKPTKFQKIFSFPKDRCNSRVHGAFFTHKGIYTYEAKAKLMDFCVCPCNSTAEYVKKYNFNTHVVYHGIDLDKFKPALRLGFIGRLSDASRKGDDLLSMVSSIPFVELVCTNGKLKEEEIPSFYQTIDYVFIPSRTEGGPLCFQEGLASGKEIISTDVGMVHDFKDVEGIHIFDRDKPETLTNLLNALYEKKMKLRRYIEQYSIDFFINQHLEIFKRYCFSS